MHRGLILPTVIMAGVVLGACGGPSGSQAASDVPSAAPSEDDAPRFSTAGWATDFSIHSVPFTEIISGGPGKDGIPALDASQYERVGDVTWLAASEPVIAVEINGEARAYPIQILIWHEIANDTLADIPIAVTFCPLCHTAIVYDRRLDGAVHQFGVSGKLRHSDMVMFDRATESWWQQATGEAIVGTLTGSQLEFLPSQLMGWQQFAGRYPEGTVLSRETGHNRSYGSNPYIGYDDIDTSPFLLDDVTLLDGRLSPKLRVLAVALGDEAAAYPFPDLAVERVVNDEVGGVPLVILFWPGVVSGLGGDTVAGGDEVGSAAAFVRQLDDELLDFEAAGEGAMRDRQTGSTWDFTGLATDGPLTGRQLEPVAADSPFWFAWAIFRPETRIWQP
ncbi:MAG: DUF3179 domain-containing protein [Chloroflexota bacterium]